jgi:hypothetical protein
MTKRVEYKKPLIANGSWNYLCDDDIVKHPFPPTEVTLHLRYLEATGNNVAAALLLDYFSYYCRRMSSDHGIEWITLSISDIQEDFMSAFGTRVITRALELLVELNLLSRRKDPNDPFQGSRQYQVNFSALEKLRSQDRPVRVPDKKGSQDRPRPVRVSDISKKGQTGIGFGVPKSVG